MLEAILSKAFLAKAATVIAGLSLATTGAGAADVLPQVAQDRVAAAVEKASPLDLPDSHDTAGKTEAPDDAAEAADPAAGDDDADEGEGADKPEKPEQAKDNFGQIVSARAHSTEDKGREFGQSVSAEARARAVARQGAKSGGDDQTGDDETEDDSDDEARSAAKSHGPSANPADRGNQGSGRRP